MVPYLNLSLFDLTILLIIIISIPVGLIYYSDYKSDHIVMQSVEIKESKSCIITYPLITIVFQKDIIDDEVLSKEIADLYIANRAYYYSGTILPKNGKQKNTIKENEIYIKYDNVDFSTLFKIDV